MADVQLTMDDSGSELQLTPGDTVKVSLDQIASTGYRWSLEPDHDSILALQDEATRSSSSIGSKGTVDWVFRAEKPGTTELQLKLWREWEGDKSVIERFKTTVNVS